MNSIKFMFRARNNVLPKNLQLLYKANSNNGNLFHKKKFELTENHFVFRMQVQCCRRN